MRAWQSNRGSRWAARRVPLDRSVDGVAWAAFGPPGEQSYLYAPHRPGIAHHFAKPSLRLSEMTYGLHLTEPESDLWRERLAFRDALRGDAVLAAEYEALKLRLA